MAKCPGGKIRSKGKGKDKGRGRGLFGYMVGKTFWDPKVHFDEDVKEWEGNVQFAGESAVEEE